MTMRDWIAKLDDFMRISDREILTHAGNVSHEAALARAEAEFEKFRRIEDVKPSPVEQHFIEAIEQVKQLESGKRTKKKKSWTSTNPSSKMPPPNGSGNRAI